MANYKASAKYINIFRFFIARYFDTLKKFYDLGEVAEQETMAFLFAHMVLWSVVRQNDSMFSIGNLCAERISKLSAKLDPTAVKDLNDLATHEYALRLYEQECLAGHTCAYMRNRRTMQLIKNKDLACKQN